MNNTNRVKVYDILINFKKRVGNVLILRWKEKKWSLMDSTVCYFKEFRYVNYVQENLKT